jgi:hypothetical protein
MLDCLIGPPISLDPLPLPSLFQQSGFGLTWSPGLQVYGLSLCLYTLLGRHCGFDIFYLAAGFTKIISRKPVVPDRLTRANN